jgi:hypothetical protein
MYQYVSFHLLTIKMHYIHSYVDDSMLCWVKREFGLLPLTYTNIKSIFILLKYAEYKYSNIVYISV